MRSKRFLHVSGIIALMAISMTGFAQTKVVVIPLSGDDVGSITGAAHSSSNLDISFTGTEIVATVTIQPPADGFVLAIGNVSIYQKGNNAPLTGCSLSLDNQMDKTREALTTGDPFDSWSSVAAQAFISVTKGTPLLVNLVCQIFIQGDAAATRYNDPAITLIYVPQNYQ